jgi:hypothetical protein
MKKQFTTFLLGVFFLLQSLASMAQNEVNMAFKSDAPNVSLPACASQDEIDSQFTSWKDAVVDYIYEFEGTEGCDESLNWTINGNGTIMSTQTCPSLYNNIINLFPEQKNAMEADETEDLFVANGFDPGNLNVVLEEETEVYVSFVWEGAGWTNTLGYYTYHIDNPPTSVDDLEKHVLFENASINGNGGNLNTGDTKQIGTGVFPAGTVIGFYLVAKGWNNNNNSLVAGQYTHYTNVEFNPDNMQQHTLFMEDFDNGCGDMVMTFEDTRISGGDKDFNDLIFIVRKDVDQLLLDLTPPTNCGGAVEIEWQYSSSCDEGDSGFFSFDVEGITEDDITFDLPANIDALYSNQAELDEAFNLWLADAAVTGGCESGTVSVNPAQPAAPSVCGGSIEVTWTYKDDCLEVSQTRSFNVQTNVPVVSCPDDIFASTQNEPIVLDGEGIFQGPGISLDEEAGVYVFSPADAGVGQHILYYSLSNEAGCVNSCVFFAEVVAMPDFSCIPDFSVCSTDNLIDLINSEYDGGVYSGMGIVGGNSFDPTLAEPGVHEITYTLDNEYGTFSCTFFVTVNATPDVTLAPFGNVCTNTESLVLTGGMPEGGVYTGSGVTDGVFNPSDLSEGEYEITYTVTNENGCSASATQTIEVGLAPCLDISHTDACFGETNGSITVDVTCGDVTELCLLYPGEPLDKCTPDKIGGAVYTNLAPGTYQIVATAANGCVTIEEVVIGETSEVILELVSSGDVSEFGAADGFLEVAASGGTPGYEYLWQFGETTTRIENLDPGSYTVVAFDANNCSATGTFVVGGPTQPADILVDLGVTIEVNIQTPDPEEVDELTFALVVTNHDTEETATGVVVENAIPQPFPFIARLDDGTSGSFDHLTGMWTIGNIPAGEHRILVYRTQMLLTEAEENKNWQSGLNTAQILPFDQVDPVLENNYAEVLVTVGESSGGDDNGIESNGSMASQLALRNHRRLVENREIARTERVQQMESFKHVSMLTGEVKSATVGGETATGIGMLLPEDGPAKTRAFVSTPYDLLGITNAKEIFSVDYLQENNARRAAVLAISTESSSVYEHTKVICDRLMGAELQNVEMIEIAGKPFILSHLVHPNGYIDYSVSFIAQRKGGKFVIDNRWYNEEYQLLNSDDVFNFQVWSVTPQFTRELVEEILDNMNLNGGLSFRNEEIAPSIPQVYVHSGRYTNGGLLLNLVNKVGADKITIYGNKTLFENGQREPMHLTLDIPTNEFVEVFVPTGFLFDAGFSISNNKDDAPDLLYYSDGAWMFDYDPGNAEVTHFSTKAESNEIEPVDYKVERDASFTGRVRTWATMFRTLSPRSMPVDISTFDQIVFNAQGQGVVEVMLAKKSINQWSDQFRTTITLSNDEKEYRIAFEDLLTKDGVKGFTAEDVVSVIFNPIGNGSVASDFDVNVSNLHFANSRFVDANEAIFYPAYPNPFRNTTTMDVMVKKDNSLVKVEVLNMFGQTIEVLVNEEMGAGSFKLNWNPVSHNPGVYMIKMTVGDSAYTSKVIYNK